jgi:hypothetical protein
VAYRTYIPPEVLIKVPDMNLHQVRAMINVVINSMDNVTRQSSLLYFKIPRIGVIRSHGRKKPKAYKKMKKKDVSRKRKEARLKELTKESLLW